MNGVSAEQCKYGCVQNSSEEIAAMANFPNMRLYQNTHGSSSVPLAESNNTGWLVPKAMGGSFSAMCWFFGRNLYAAMEKRGTPRPIGLVKTNVGGTRIGTWSSHTALQNCENIRHNPPWNKRTQGYDATNWNSRSHWCVTASRGQCGCRGSRTRRKTGASTNVCCPQWCGIGGCSGEQGLKTPRTLPSPLDGVS
jgi:hypothetical protein